MKKEYSIKQVSEIFNITTNKIRFYEKKGLIKPKRNEENGYRYFINEDLVKLQTILMYRELNLNIEDIKDLLKDDSKNNTLNHYYKQWQAVNREIHKMKLLKDSLEEIMDNIYEKENHEYAECILETTKEMSKVWNIKDSWKDKWNFDSWARNYDKDVKKDKGSLKIYKNYQKILNTVYDMAVNNMHKDSKVLEIGVGTGNLASKFLTDGYNIIGLDQSRQMLNVAKEKHPNLRLRLGEFLKIPFDNNSFDIIVSTYAFHHLNDEEKEIAVNEMVRVLNKNGKIVIGDLMFENKEEEKKIKEAMTEIQVKEIEDEYYTNIELLKEVFKTHGMEMKITRIDELMFIIECE